MAHWVKCTGEGDAGTEIFVNLELAFTLSAHGSGARIAFAGNAQTAQYYVDVAETPSQILNGSQARIYTQNKNAHVGWHEANMNASMV